MRKSVCKRWKMPCIRFFPEREEWLLKAANTAKLLVQLVILIQLLWYSGWLPANVTTWFQLASLVLLAAVLFVLRKKRKKPRKKPAVKEKMEEAANE